MAGCTFFARRLPDCCAFVLTKWSENRGAVPAGRSAVHILMINIKIIYVARDLQSGESAARRMRAGSSAARETVLSMQRGDI
jgi:hypothetical protein